MAKGYTLTANAVRKLKGLLRNEYVNGSEATSGVGNTKVQFPHPFKVMYAADTGTLTSGEYSGAWIVYLPEGACSVPNVNPREDLSPAANYDGWYDLTPALEDMVDEDYEDWILIFDVGQRAASSSSSNLQGGQADPNPRFYWKSTETPSPTRLQDVTLPIMIANIKDDYVQQLVRSALTSAGGGSGDGMFAWDSATKSIGRGGVMIGRTFYEATGTLTPRNDQGDILYALKVTLGATSTVEVAALTYSGGVIALPQPNDNVSYLPLYVVQNNAMTIDLRGCFVVPSWE